MIRSIERAIRVGTGVAIGVNLLFGVGCEDPIQKAQVTATATAKKSEQELEAWKRLSGEVRLPRLTQLDYPRIVGFDPRKELAFAVAERYCQVTRCTTPFQDLASKVQFLPVDPFVDQYRKSFEDYKEYGFNPTEEEINKELDMARTSIPEFVKTRGEGIFFNTTLLDELAPTFKKAFPRLEATLGKDDVKMVITESALWHAYAHENQKKRSIIIPPYTVGDLNTGMLVTFNRMEGFTLFGHYQNGKGVVMMGFEEPIADWTGRTLAVRAGRRYLSFTPRYAKSADLLDLTTKKAGITEDQLLSIANGDLSQQVLWDKLSTLKDPRNPNGQAVTRSLYTLGLFTQEESGLDEATLRRALSESLGVN